MRYEPLPTQRGFWGRSLLHCTFPWPFCTRERKSLFLPPALTSRGFSRGNCLQQVRGTAAREVGTVLSLPKGHPKPTKKGQRERWRKRTWRERTPFLPPSRCSAASLGSKSKYHGVLRIKTSDSSSSTLTPVALKGQSYRAGTRSPHTHSSKLPGVAYTA